MIVIDNTDFAAAARAWQHAAQELCFEIVSPFVLQNDLRAHNCIAWLPHFFSKKRGVLVVGHGTLDKTFISDSNRLDYSLSIINMQSYSVYDRQLFIDTLLDWGYFGPIEKKPSWYVSSVSWTVVSPDHDTTET